MVQGVKRLDGWGRRANIHIGIQEIGYNNVPISLEFVFNIFFFLSRMFVLSFVVTISGFILRKNPSALPFRETLRVTRVLVISCTFFF